MSNNPSIYRSQNHLLQKLDGFERAHRVPFKNNDLIEKNPNLSSQVNEMSRGRRRGTETRTIEYQDLSKLNNPNMKRGDIISELLKPMKVDNKQGNEEVRENFSRLQDEYRVDKKKNLLLKEFPITNEPYKNIMHEHKIEKPVDQITPKDMVIFDAKDIKTLKKSKDPLLFMSEYQNKKKANKKLNAYLEMEYGDERHNQHLDQFKYKESYVTRLKDDGSKTFDETKHDYIEYYEEQQKKNEEGIKQIDSTLRSLVDQGIIRKEDLPVDI